LAFKVSPPLISACSRFITKLFSPDVKISPLKSRVGKYEPSFWIECSYTHENIRHLLLARFTNILSHTYTQKNGCIAQLHRREPGGSSAMHSGITQGSSRQAAGGRGDTTNLEKVEECWLN